MGSHVPYESSYNESALFSNQNPPSIPVMQSTSAADVDELTNHRLIPNLSTVPRSVPKKYAGADIVVIKVTILHHALIFIQVARE